MVSHHLDILFFKGFCTVSNPTSYTLYTANRKIGLGVLILNSVLSKKILIDAWGADILGVWILFSHKPIRFLLLDIANYSLPEVGISEHPDTFILGTFKQDSSNQLEFAVPLIVNAGQTETWRFSPCPGIRVLAPPRFLTLLPILEGPPLTRFDKIIPVHDFFHPDPGFPNLPRFLAQLHQLLLSEEFDGLTPRTRYQAILNLWNNNLTPSSYFLLLSSFQSRTSSTEHYSSRHCFPEDHKAIIVDIMNLFTAIVCVRWSSCPSSSYLYLLLHLRYSFCPYSYSPNAFPCHVLST